MKRLDFDNLLSLMDSNDFAVFERDDKNFNLNLVAVRMPDTKINSFDDKLFCFWRFRKIWQVLEFQCTTDPGSYWLGAERMGNSAGTAMLVQQQVRGMYKWGKHRNYAALEQKRPAKFVRDANQDGVLNPDFSRVYNADISTNLHRASQFKHTRAVGPHSAGCVVVANPYDFALLGHTCKLARKLWGNSFTFTLLDLKYGPQHEAI